MAGQYLALLTVVLLVVWASAAPAPDPDPDPGCGFDCCKPSCDGGLVGVIVSIIELVVGLLFGLLFAVVSIVVSLLGPVTDTTTLLGALKCLPTTLEGFIGSLPLVLKFLNILNVPTAILG